MNNPSLYLGLGGLLIVFFLVMIYFFTKTWRWFHVVCVVLVFGSSLFLLRITAALYRTLDVWRTQAVNTGSQIERLEAENRLLLVGRDDDTEQTVESIRLLRAKTGRITMDQGRVWRQCVPQPPQADHTVVVGTVPPATAGTDPAADPAAAAPAASTPNLIQDQSVLYVFLEDTPPPQTGAPEGQKVPFYYVGEFVVVSATNTAVTLKPLKPLSAFDQARIRQGNTWALYETMPVDGHEWFSMDPDAKPNWNVPGNEAPVFGKFDETVIRAIFEWPRLQPQAFADQPAEFQVAVARLGAVLEAYLRDGKTVANRDDFKPFEVWTKVRFIKPKTETVDSATKVTPFAAGVTDDFFDASGMAEVALLQLGKDAEFKENDVAIFPQADAQALIDAGFCRFEEHVYVRPLNDYAYLFLSLDQQLDRVANDTQQVRRDIRELQNAQANAVSQAGSANDEQSKLRQDLTKTQYEAGKITEYANVLEKHWGDTRNQLTQLFQKNLELHDELARRHQELTDALSGGATGPAKN